MKQIGNTVRVERSQALTSKRPYRRPNLKVYGRLNLLTQGSGGTKGDGQAGMTRIG